MGTSEFSDNSIAIKYLATVPCGDGLDDDCITIRKGLSYVAKKGGAVHNKVPRIRGR